MASVEAHDLWKRFRLRHDRANSIGQLLMRMLPGKRPEPEPPFWALRDISFSMRPNESLGIIGNNGSGKSTLLKILTRTMLPTSGTIQVRGRVSALIELGAGFHPDFTGRENIILNASILGISRRDISRRMEDIIDFSGIQQFIDTPVKYYSTGMNARLGFSVAIHVSPEILIVDEVLAVGDEAFQQKCMERIFSMKRAGISILLVSHDLSSIERLMDRALWIDRGVLRASGAPRDVVRVYRDHLGDPSPDRERPAGEPHAHDSTIRLRSGDVRALEHSGDVLAPGDHLRFRIALDNDGPETAGHLSVVVRRPDGLEVAGISTLQDMQPVLIRHGPTVITLETDPFFLASGRYEVDATCLTLEGRRVVERAPLLAFSVQAQIRTPGLLVVPHRWQEEGGQ